MKGLLKSSWVWLLGLLAAAAIAFPGSAGAAPAPRYPGLCNRDEAGASVVAEFQLDRAEDMAAHVPRFGQAPEFGSVPFPWRVLVFEGDHHAVPRIGGLERPGTQRRLPHNVVCAVAPGGDMWYFSDIDLTGLKESP